MVQTVSWSFLPGSHSAPPEGWNLLAPGPQGHVSQVMRSLVYPGLPPGTGNSATYPAVAQFLCRQDDGATLLSRDTTKGEDAKKKKKKNDKPDKDRLT